MKTKRQYFQPTLVVTSRLAAVLALGLDWYGALLDRMRFHGIEMAPLSAENLVTMQASINAVFDREAT